MNLRAKFLFSISLLGLLCLTMPGALRADDFTFSFTNTVGNVPGTVTGDIYGLANNGIAGPASQVTLSGYPALPYEVNLGTPSVNTLPSWTVEENSFTETDGVISNAEFVVYTPGGDDFLILLTEQNELEQLIHTLDNINYYTRTASTAITFAPLVVATPEPGTTTLTLTGLGLLGLLVVMRKRYARSFPQAT